MPATCYSIVYAVHHNLPEPSLNINTDPQARPCIRPILASQTPNTIIHDKIPQIFTSHMTYCPREHPIASLTLKGETPGRPTTESFHWMHG